MRFDLKAHACREFCEMQEFVDLISKTVKVMSWGAHGWTNVYDKALGFQVDARRHKGGIVLTINASDLFDVYLIDAKTEVLDVIKDVYIDQLIDVIDERIEKVDCYKF